MGEKKFQLLKLWWAVCIVLLTECLYILCLVLVFSGTLITHNTLDVNITKPCGFSDFERHNALLHIFGFLVNQKKFFLTALLEEGTLRVLFCSMYYCSQLIKRAVTILTVCFPSSLANQSYCKPLLLSWKVRVYPECEHFFLPFFFVVFC